MAYRKCGDGVIKKECSACKFPFGCGGLCFVFGCSAK
jgi:hypothetical protein